MMLEMGLAALLVTVAVVAVGTRSQAVTQSPGPLLLTTVDESSDLPCPWCRAATREVDDHCPSCGQRFG